MIFSGINKPNSKKIRTPSVSLWSSSPWTRRRGARSGGGVSEGLPSPVLRGLRAGIPGRARTVSTRFFLGPSPSILLGCQPGSRHPAVLVCSPGPRSAAPGLGPGPGEAQTRARGPAEPGGRGSCWLPHCLKGPVEKERGLCKGCWGGARAPAAGARGCGDRLATCSAVSSALHGAFRLKKKCCVGSR